MWTHRVVVASPILDHDLGLLQCVENLAVEQLIAQLAIEAFAIAILPWASRLDVSGPGSDGGDPIPKRLGDELRAVVRTDVRRDAPRDEQLAECLDDIGRLELPRDTDGQALAAELVDDAQHPERLAIVGAVSDEVIGPDMVGPLQTDAGTVVEPQTPAFRLFGRDLQPLAPPDPLNTFFVHPPAGSAKQRRDSAISVAAILAGKLDDVGGQSRLVIGCRGDLALRRSVLTQCPARSSLGDAKLDCDMIDARAASRGA